MESIEGTCKVMRLNPYSLCTSMLILIMKHKVKRVYKKGLVIHEQTLELVTGYFDRFNNKSLKQILSILKLEILGNNPKRTDEIISNFIKDNKPTKAIKHNNGD